LARQILKDRWGFHRPGEVAVELAGDVSLEAAADLSWGLSLGCAPAEVDVGAGAAADPGEPDLASFADPGV
jgi:hypothetical protein